MAGIKTLLIDKSGSTSQLPKAILIDDKGLRSVQAVGLFEELRKGLIMGYGAKYHLPDGECFATISPDEQNYGYPKRNSFLQPDLERILLRGLARFPCVEVCFNTELTDLVNSEHEASVSLMTRSGEQRGVSTLCVLACDGAKSKVRSLLGIVLEGRTYAQDWIVIDTTNDPDKDKFSKFYCDPARPGVSIPAPHGGRRYEFRMMDGESAEDVTQQSYVKLLLKPFRNIEDHDITRATVYTFHAKIADTLCSNRVVLMGDAAHLTPPFAGQGMNAGLRDSHNVAWKAILLAQGLADVTILKSYEEERREPIAEMIDYAVALGDIVMPTNQLQAETVRTLNDTLSLLPDSKDYVLNMKFKPNPKYKTGLFISDLEIDSPIAGTLLPQPLVKSCNNDEIKLLDNYLGIGFSLLALGFSALKTLEEKDPANFSKLAPRVVCLLTDKNEIPEAYGNDCVVLRCDDKSFMDYIKEYRSQVLLIRPDRYVAGVFQASDFDDFSDSLMKKMTSAIHD